MTLAITWVAIITIIGASSSGPIVVGITFFIQRYKGSIIFAINCGLKFAQASLSQERITSANTSICKAQTNI